MVVGDFGPKSSACTHYTSYVDFSDLKNHRWYKKIQYKNLMQLWNQVVLSILTLYIHKFNSISNHFVFLQNVCYWEEKTLLMGLEENA